ncbi:uncharacterized protein B0I36DRAFT_9242 [Microdochium trichocladiopsis]|uniref:Uncharacterized protein n=1 Tax=Microdochium trichocladiopsis TaxID=1682393 RepID=A0A9P8YJ69_9PEZI|nr:uncharacterized protein B0I36DRAFT_9242 [Microdochium trichocladiopsis]KAH7040366.1 hypothetical protein B0I36DRAFT_9242 [Microdochium trichocladiopsis]
MRADCNKPINGGTDTSTLPAIFGLDDRAACMSACVAHFVTARRPETAVNDVGLSSICPVVQDGPAQDLWSLYCCDITFCGLQIPLSTPHGQSNSVDNVISTCQNFGFFAINDPGPPPLAFTCTAPNNAAAFWVSCAASGSVPAIAPVSDNIGMSIAALGDLPAIPSTVQEQATSSSTSIAATATVAMPSDISTETLRSAEAGLSTVSSISSLVTPVPPSVLSGSARPSIVDVPPPSLDTQQPAVSTEEHDASNSSSLKLPEGAKAAIIAGCLLAVVLIAAIVLCFLQRRRRRAESMEIGATMAAATISHATFDTYSIDRPSGGSDSRLILGAPLTAGSNLSPPLTPPPRLGERRMLSLGSTDGSSRGSLTTKSSSETMGPASNNAPSGLARTTTPSQNPGSGASSAVGSPSGDLPAGLPQSWPLSPPQPGVLGNNNINGHIPRNLGGCGSPPPVSPLPRLPISPPSTPQPTSPLALVVSPPLSPRRTTAATSMGSS